MLRLEAKQSSCQDSQSKTDLKRLFWYSVMLLQHTSSRAEITAVDYFKQGYNI